MRSERFGYKNLVPAGNLPPAPQPTKLTVIPALSENNQLFVNWYFSFGEKYCTFKDLLIKERDILKTRDGRNFLLGGGWCTAMILKL